MDCYRILLKEIVEIYQYRVIFLVNDHIVTINVSMPYALMTRKNQRFPNLNGPFDYLLQKSIV